MRIAQLKIQKSHSEFYTISDILRGLGAPGTQVIRRLRLFSTVEWTRQPCAY